MPVEYKAPQHSTAQHSTIQFLLQTCTAQHSRAQHSTVQITHSQHRQFAMDVLANSFILLNHEAAICPRPSPAAKILNQYFCIGGVLITCRPYSRAAFCPPAAQIID